MTRPDPCAASNEAELAIIEGMLLANHLIPDVVGQLPAEARIPFYTVEKPPREGVSLFYSPAYQLVFEIILRVAEQNRPVDLIVLQDELLKMGKLEELGGSVFLASLEDGGFFLSSRCMPSYVRIVCDHWVKRQVMKFGSEIPKVLSEEDAPVEILGEKLAKIQHIQTPEPDSDLVSLADEAVKELALTPAEKGEALVLTGFRDLDDCLFGLKPGNLLLVGARPSVGKTLLMTQVAVHVALNQGRPVLFFSLEMSAEEISSRILAWRAGVAQNSLRRRRLSDAEFKKVAEAQGELKMDKLWIDTSSNLDIGAIRLRAQHRKARNPDLALVCVDYVQLVRTRNLKNRALEVGEVARSLKLLAGELQLPVFAACQLNRAPEGEKEPKLHHLRESGELEAHADVVMLLDRDLQKTTLRLNVAKHRNGPLARTTLEFDRQTVFFNEQSRPTAPLTPDLDSPPESSDFLNFR